jgi:hypothetical protein
MDHHAVAAVSVIGICLDLLGGLYLAYDLLGGQNGPLRLLTRMATYSILFGIGFGLGLGLFFGVAAGAATGITLSIELQRAGQRQDHYPLRWEVVFSAIRALGFSVGLYPAMGIPYALTFGVVNTLGQAVAYSKGMRPGLDYQASRQPRITRRQGWGVVRRTIGHFVTALICAAVVRQMDHAWVFAIRLGLVVGLVTAVGTTFYPYIEYFADNLPARRMGVFGVWLVLCGFILQSVQYWLAILDIPVT